MPAILSIGSDAMLLQTRSSLLRQIQAEIRSVSCDQAILELGRNRYDVAIVCHSLSPAETTKIANAIKNAANGCKMLLLSRDFVPGTHDGVERCSAHRPELLLRTVERMTSR